MNAILVVLVNGLWQGVAIAALTWIALRLFPKANASTRYAAWTVALLAVILVPLLTSSVRSVAPQTSGSARLSMLKLAAPDAALRSTSHSPRSQSSGDAISGGPSRSERTASGANGSRYGVSVPDILLSVPLYVTAVVFGVWGLAALALVLRLAVALFRLEKLKRDALPLGIDVRDRMQQWQRLSQRDRDVRICVTDGIEVPVAVGLFDAMVLLPQHLLQQLDASEIDQVSLHELAHLLRHDDWTNGLQRAVTALLFFNPAVWFIARQMDIEREVACDDYVLELTGAVRSYAFCLTKMAERTAWPHEPLAAPGVFTTRKNISIRIERLLRTGRAIGSQISPAAALAVVAGLAGVFVLARAFTPVVAFAMPESAIFATPAPESTASAEHKAVTKEKVVPKPAITKPRPAGTKHPELVADLTNDAPGTPAPASKSVRVTVPAISVSVPATVVHVPGMTITVPNEARRIAQASSPHPGMDCQACDFSHHSLVGTSFSGSNLAGSNFEGADLHGVSFRGANLSGVDFSNADLRNAEFTGANLGGADLDGAKLDGADFTGANLSGTSIDARVLAPSQVREYAMHCRGGCDLSGANLHGADLHGIRLTGVDLSNADLRGANLDNAVFSAVNFSDADLRGASTNGTRFIGCDFSGAKLGKP
jgi:uncharacterized protein YjbI with pentapeptide repeats/beta-lactamase regulating signal transducer with metallopeptidase domain